MEKDWVLSHIAIAVRDPDDTIELYESAGIGVHNPIKVGPPPPPDEVQPERINLKNGKVQEKVVAATPEEAAKMMTFLHVGDLQYETGWNWAQDVERSDHICFNVANLHEESVPLQAKGCEVPFVFIMDSLIQENHIDTTKFGGIKISFRPDGGRSQGEAALRKRLGVSDWKFRGMAIAVKDLDKVVEYYEDLGIGTFQPEYLFDSSTIGEFQEDGKTPNAAIKDRVRIAQVGPVTYEFTEPMEGETIYKDALEKRGEGVAGLVFTVADLDKETANLVDNGVPVVRSGNPKNGGAFAYFDIHKSRNTGSILIKLVQA